MSSCDALLPPLPALLLLKILLSAFTVVVLQTSSLRLLIKCAFLVTDVSLLLAQVESGGKEGFSACVML